MRRDELARLLDARTVQLPPVLVRTALAAAWRVHALRAPADLFDAFMRIPIMPTDRVRSELEWEPEHSGLKALSDMVVGARELGSQMPPLAPD